MTIVISSHIVDPYKIVMTCTECNTKTDIPAPVDIWQLAEYHNQHFDSGKCLELQGKK